MPIEKGNILLSIARSTIASELGSSVSAPADALWLQEQGTTFVTLMQAGELRGCNTGA